MKSAVVASSSKTYDVCIDSSTVDPAVSREVAWLEHNKYILKEGRNLRIVDPAALRALVDEDWG